MDYQGTYGLSRYIWIIKVQMDYQGTYGLSRYVWIIKMSEKRDFTIPVCQSSTKLLVIISSIGTSKRVNIHYYGNITT